MSRSDTPSRVRAISLLAPHGRMYHKNHTLFNKAGKRIWVLGPLPPLAPEVGCEAHIEFELERIQSHVTQKPMMRVCCKALG